jgi:DNA-binding MarR family transcriptional regulator
MDGKTGEISIVDYRRLAEFRYQIRQFVSFSEQAARTAGLEPRQHQLLLAIKGLPIGAEPTVGELAERLQIHHNSAVELINRLEERGLVERQRGEIDRRQVFVHLSAKGEAELSELSRHHLEELRAIGPKLVQALTALLEEQRIDEE